VVSEPPSTGGAERLDVVVVGAGLLGLATASAVARRGRQVTVLEQATPGHQGAGSAGSCRIFRLGYPDPRYVAAARRARGLWQELERRTGRQILFRTPQLTIGAELSQVAAAMRAAGAPCELLTAAEVTARFPGIAAGGAALLEPESCVTSASTALAALAGEVTDIRTGLRVSGLADDGRQATLTTDRGRLTARVVVVCAGPWTSGLLGGGRGGTGVRVPSAPTLEQAAYLAPADSAGAGAAEAAGACGPEADRTRAAPAAGSPAARVPAAGSPAAGSPRPAAAQVTAPRSDLPIFICHGEQAPYGLPVPGSGLYKIGIHPAGPPVSPDAQSQEPDPVLSGRLAEVARRYLPGLDPRPADVERCIYDNTPDQDFILDRVGNVVIGSGTSGHGFKFGPLLGEWLATLAGVRPDAGRLAGGMAGDGGAGGLAGEFFGLARLDRFGPLGR
jgi:sarcosine oxidase